jgi:hypothetical protein
METSSACRGNATNMRLFPMETSSAWRCDATNIRLHVFSMEISEYLGCIINIKLLSMETSSACRGDATKIRLNSMEMSSACRLIDCLRFYVPLKNFSLMWRRHHCRWRAAKFWPMLGAQGLWAGRDLYRAAPAVTRDLGSEGPPHLVASYDTRGDVEDLF